MRQTSRQMEPILGGGGATSTRGRLHRKTPSSDRFFGVFSSSPPSTTGVELTEHDIFDSSAESTPSTSASPSSSTNPNPNHFNHHQPRHHQKHFGILAALPASETRSVFNHKASASSATSATASVSSSSSSSSTPSSSVMIPTIPNPRRPPAIEKKMKFLHQSAPVNVPILSAAVAEERRRRRWFDDIGEEDEDEEDVENVQILPPHEIVAAKQTPELACSVLEGVGRTLKGRDLRQVRNAVFRKTGFLD